MKRVKLLSILLCLLVVFFPSCNGNSTSPEATGSITVKIEDSTTIGGGEKARGVEPQNYEVASYEILASGPEGAHQSAELKKGTSEHTFSNVAPGNWTITVNANTENGETIGSGTATVTVTPGQNASCSIEVKEIQGEGEINFNITDSTGALTALTAEISNDKGIVATAELNKNDQNIFSGSVKVDNGFYMVSIKAGENEILKVDSVRVYADITTIYNGTYDGETIDVTVTDEIIKTPDLTLTITSGASVAANGTLTASATVTNLENPSYSWYINGTKLENSTDSDLSYKIEGSAYAEEEALEVTVFISNGSIIWSESKTVTVTEAVTLPSEVTISQDKTAYGSEITLSYETDVNIPEGTAATWTVKGTVLESATFAPSIIGHEIPVSLTLNAGGVTQTYTSSIEINPVVSNFNVTPNSVPEKAVLAVESTVNAPEDAVLSAVIGEETIDVSGGKLTLPDELSGEVSISWSISYNGDTWTGEDPVTVTVTESAATEKPADISGNPFAGFTTDEKIEVAKEIEAIVAEACTATLHEVSDGFSSLDGTVTKAISEGDFSFHGYNNGNTYIIWGDGRESSFELTVKDASNNVFTLSITASGYTLNGESLRVIPTTPPSANTDTSFGGSTEEKINLIDTIVEEITNAINSGITDRLEYTDNYDGTYTYKMSGYTAGDYIVWGSSTVNVYPLYVKSAEVTIQYGESVFTAGIENGIYSLNGKDCILPLESPVEPSDDIKAPGNITETMSIEEMEIAESILSLGSSSEFILMPLPEIILEMPDGQYGNINFTNSDGIMSFTLSKDISVMDMLTIKSGSFVSTDVTGYEHTADITVTTSDMTYRYVCQSNPYFEEHFYEISADGSEIEITDSEELSSISEMLSGVDSYISMMSISEIGNDSRFKEKFLNKDLQVGNTAIVRVYEFDMSSLMEGGQVPTMDYIVSMQKYPMQNYYSDETFYVTSAGLKVTSESTIDSVTISIKGPADINGDGYYFDVTFYSSRYEGNKITGGVRINEVWKTGQIM